MPALRLILLSLIVLWVSSCANFGPPEPVEIKAPTTVSVKSLDDQYPFFLVVFNPDHTVWYQAALSMADSIKTKLDTPVKESLKPMIAKFKQDCEKSGLMNARYLIKGDNNVTTYENFKTVLAAFKENEIFKFQMITMSEAQELLPQPMKDSNRRGRSGSKKKDPEKNAE